MAQKQKPKPQPVKPSRVGDRIRAMTVAPDAATILAQVRAKFAAGK